MLLENEERIKKEAEREKKRLEKDMKEKQAREEREKKQKEKDDLKKQKEDEEKRKHEEKEKEQKAQEEREEKARQQRAKFFQSFSKKKISTKNEKIEHESRWAPFCPHKNQFLCPIVFHKWTDSEEKDFEKFLKLLCDGKSNLAKEIKYLHEIKSRPPRCRGKREKPKKSEDECILIDPQLETALKEGARFKYFNFHTDYRPPFYGTNRKKSQFVNPKNPHAKDPDLDYDYDSGEDWEEEPEGEKISDDEKLSDEEDMDEEDEDGFFVPHGYLSDDEENAARDPDDPEERHKLTEAELKERQEKFNRMRKKRLRKLVVHHEGPLYDADSEETDNLEKLNSENQGQQDNEADRFDWEGVHYLLEGSPDPLRDYSDNEIGSIDGIWNEIPSSEESQIENVQLDDDEEESLVDADDLNPSDEEDFVELENQAWDNSEMKNWSDFEKVRDELVKFTAECKESSTVTDVTKTESEVELEAIWSVEKKQRRKRTRAHASKASVTNLRPSRYVDLTNMKLILTDGVQSGNGLPIDDFQGLEYPSKAKDNDVVEALSNVSLDENDTDSEKEETFNQEKGEDDTHKLKNNEIIHGDVIEILSSGEDANERGQESEDIPDTEDDEESLGESDSEDEETLEDTADHDSIQCSFPDEEQDTEIQAGGKRKISPVAKRLDFGVATPKKGKNVEKQPSIVAIDSDSNPAPIQETPKINILIPKKKKKKQES